MLMHLAKYQNLPFHQLERRQCCSGKTVSQSERWQGFFPGEKIPITDQNADTILFTGEKNRIANEAFELISREFSLHFCTYGTTISESWSG